MSSYESEYVLEEKMILQLIKQGYEKIKINDEKDLSNKYINKIYKHNEEV